MLPHHSKVEPKPPGVMPHGYDVNPRRAEGEKFYCYGECGDDAARNEAGHDTFGGVDTDDNGLWDCGTAGDEEAEEGE